MRADTAKIHTAFHPKGPKPGANVTAGHNVRPNLSNLHFPVRRPVLHSLLHTSMTVRSKPSASGSREDCWSDGATAALIDAWGDRYLLINRGSLRHKDWQAVSDAVNRRDDGVKRRKSDVQCKNRIDTLKKKYKVEKARPIPSRWPFFHRLDSLVGAASSAENKDSSVKHKRRVAPTETPFGGFAAEGDCDVGMRENEVTELRSLDGASWRELARAILKFGEIYERIETLKQRQMMELEKQRLEFTKDLESQRMNMFIDTQLEMEKVKRQKLVPRTGSATSVQLQV